MYVHIIQNKICTREKKDSLRAVFNIVVVAVTFNKLQKMNVTVVNLLQNYFFDRKTIFDLQFPNLSNKIYKISCVLKL